MDILPADGKGIERALSTLRDGGIIAHATETCYGFACDVTSLGAVANLFALKNRPFTSPVSALFASIDEAKKYVEWNDEAERLARKYLPGPLTLILPQQADAPQRLYATPLQPTTSNLPVTIGLRISSLSLAQQLVSAFGKPLTTTSANLHGQPNPYSVQDIVAQFKNQVIQPDLILDSGTIPQTPPSTVIDLTEQGKVKRKGQV